jgi:hypothetical protein
MTADLLHTHLEQGVSHKTQQKLLRTDTRQTCFETILAGYSTLSREARLSLFFAILGVPAWVILIVLSTIGVALDPRTVWVLTFSFFLGIIFNIMGIVAAILGMKSNVDSGLDHGVGHPIALRSTPWLAAGD